MLTETARKLIQSGHLKLGDEVQNAMKQQLPIVALESTIITHGMPFPDNYKTAQAVESIIRQYGCVPATIAIISGVIHVGLSNDEIIQLSEISRDNPKSIEKCTRRTLPFVLSQKYHGSTTVAATMYIAHLVGIKIFVTGGVGGVHRGVDQTWDISADLNELAQTNVTVICAGVKSILDIPKTLEYLETQGVNVVTLGSKNFPAFFVSDSGYASPLTVNSISELASMIYVSNELLNLPNGNLIAVPVSSTESAKFEIIEKATKQALYEMNEKNIQGRDVTPFLLDRVNQLTKGKSLQSNIALIKNNAKHGALLAKQLQTLEMNNGNNENETNNDGNSKKALVIGGICNDVICMPNKNVQLQLYTSNPGHVQYGRGGVGRNIAECLSKLNIKTRLVSMIGNDLIGKSLLNECSKSNIDTNFIVKSDKYPTSSYIAMHDNNGELHCAIADLNGLENCLNVSYFEQINIENQITNYPFVVLDANLSHESLRYLISICNKYNINTWFEPISIEKCIRIIDSDKTSLLPLKGVTYMSPNQFELYALLEALNYNEKIDQRGMDVSLLCKYGNFIVSKGCENVVITLGKYGVIVVSENGTTQHMPAINIEQNEIQSTNGAGDSMTAAIIAGLLHGQTLHNAIKMGLYAAYFSLKSTNCVAPDLTMKLLVSKL